MTLERHVTIVQMVIKGCFGDNLRLCLNLVNKVGRSNGKKFLLAIKKPLDYE